MTQHKIIYGLHDRDRIDLLKSMIGKENLDQSQITIVYRSSFQQHWENYTNNTNLYGHGDYKTIELVEQVLTDPFSHLIRNIKHVPKNSPKRIFVIDNYQSVAGAFDREWNQSFTKAVKAIVENDWNTYIWIATSVLNPSALLLERSIIAKFHKQLIVKKQDFRNEIRGNLFSKLTGANIDTAEETFRISNPDRLIYDHSSYKWSIFD